MRHFANRSACVVWAFTAVLLGQGCGSDSTAENGAGGGSTSGGSAGTSAGGTAGTSAGGAAGTSAGGTAGTSAGGTAGTSAGVVGGAAGAPLSDASVDTSAQDVSVESGAGCAPGACAFVPGTATVVQTSKAGDALKDLGPSTFAAPAGTKDTVVVDTTALRQEIVGYGSSFTESAAYVLQKISAAERTKALESLYGSSGAWFSLTRTTLASSDFGPVGKYAYAAKADLSDFSVVEDEPDLIPMIQDAMKASGASFKILASPWSAPPFMKDNNLYYDNVKLRGGKLLAQYYPTYATYFSKYIAAYKAKGIDIWAVTPQNEPLGNDGQWEGMEFTAQEMATFLGTNLGPTLATDHPTVKILDFDHNRDKVEAWETTVFGNANAAKYVDGTGVHWYSSSFMVYEDVIDRIHTARGNSHLIVNTEAAVGTTTITTTDYFDQWAWWWEIHGTVASWQDPVTSPPSSRVGHYLRDLVVGMNHWFNGFIDWNVVLDRFGGPRHICDPSKTTCGCAAPIMIDTTTGKLFYTPLYYVLAHFSKYVRPGARALATTAPAGLIASAAWNPDGTVAVVVANTFNNPSEYASVVDRSFRIQIGTKAIDLQIPAHAIQTIVVRPGT
jgi:glucosylceramidase